MRINPTAICRNIFLILTAMLLIRPVSAKTQDRLSMPVILPGLHLTLNEAITAIESQTGYSFVYNTTQLDVSVPVRFSAREMNLTQVLEEMFAEIPFRSVVRNGFIGIVPHKEITERANPATRIVPSNLTHDIYSRSTADADASSLNRPDSLQKNEPYEIEQVITLVPGESVERSYPVSYSAYSPAIGHSGMYTLHPRLAVKTNLLYGGALLTPNLSLEIATGPRQTFEFNGSYQWWGRKDSPSDNHKQLAHWTLRPEYRWWACERFNGHYLGAHALYSRYYVSGRDLPLLFEKEYSYDGHALGAGLTYGYHLPIGKRWGLEFNIGIGYAYMWYDRGNCSKCDPLPESKTKHYFGPTRAGVNLVFMIQ